MKDYVEPNIDTRLIGRLLDLYYRSTLGLTGRLRLIIITSEVTLITTKSIHVR